MSTITSEKKDPPCYNHNKYVKGVSLSKYGNRRQGVWRNGGMFGHPGGTLTQMSVILILMSLYKLETNPMTIRCVTFTAGRYFYK